MASFIATTMPRAMAAEDELFALHLQLDDLNLLSSTIDPKGKRRAGETNDIERAAQAYRDEIQIALQTWSDTRIAHGFAHAVEADAAILIQLQREEAQAVADQSLARRLAGQARPNTSSPPGVATNIPIPIPQVVSSSSAISSAAAPSTSPTQSSSSPNPTVIASDSSVRGSSTFGSSAAGSSSAKRSSRKDVDRPCVCCGDKSPGLTVKAPCGDIYCIDCLKDLFNMSTKDETLFPPRCHKREIPLDAIADHLLFGELRRFLAAREEFSASNRTYCSKQSCSAFIPAHDIRANSASCITCNTVTCMVCKQPEHNGDCEEDSAVKETLALARDNDWRRCGTCQRIVELTLGCYHITCICKAEWCYLCGVTWKRCACPLSDERYLLANAADRVDRQAEPGLNPAVREQRIQQMQQVLRARHDCTHPGYLRKIDVNPRDAPRGRTCEICSDRMSQFIFHCDRCNIELCYRCLRHRI